MPTKYDFHILKTRDSVKYDAAIDKEFTVRGMRFALDPLNDYSMLTHIGQEAGFLKRPIDRAVNIKRVGKGWK